MNRTLALACVIGVLVACERDQPAPAAAVARQLSTLDYAPAGVGACGLVKSMSSMAMR